jgi:hypothetical protein
MLIAIDTNKTLKFYDFIDKKKRAEEEEKVAVLQDVKSKVPGFNTKLRQLLETYDSSRTGVMSEEDFKKMVNELLTLFT